MPDKHCTGVHRPNHALGPLIKPSLWNAARQRPRIQVPLPGVDVRHWPNPPIDETRLNVRCRDISPQSNNACQAKFRLGQIKATPPVP